jgi:IclR family acetate operon transcriptional repressor
VSVSDADGGATRYSVRAVERVADILDALRQAPAGVSLGAMAEATGLPKSSVFRYLATLEARGYVQKHPQTGDFTLGVALPSQRQYLDLLARQVRPVLERLRDRFGETVNFGVLDGDRVLYLEIVESAKAMRWAARSGDRDYVHSTALGRAIAATLAESQVRGIVARAGMPALTSRTLTHVDDLLRTLEDVRANGYALDDEQNEDGARCVAVALRIPHVSSGISVSAPAVRFSSAEAIQVAAVLAEESHHVLRQLGERAVAPEQAR